jgi:hypothetical protein
MLAARVEQKNAPEESKNTRNFKPAALGYFRLAMRSSLLAKGLSIGSDKFIAKCKNWNLKGLSDVGHRRRVESTYDTWLQPFVQLPPATPPMLWTAMAIPPS